MENHNFKLQIEEDIKILQEEYGKNNPQLLKNEYAFNYWVLTKLFCIDEEIVDDNITEYSDDGCDCYVFFEEARELYIIQNKYYDDNTQLSDDYVAKKFLSGGPIDALLADKYKRSEKLKEIFNKFKEDSEFKIFLYLYITNDNVSETTKTRFEKYRNNDDRIKAYVEAKLFTIDDIHKIYYGDRKENVKKFKYSFKSRNNGTILHVDKDNYNLPNLTDAKYIMTPVELIYEIITKSQKDNYMLFSENVREYLGNKGVNAKIADTLNNDKDRDNFFYYNNGITIICDNISKAKQITIKNDDNNIEIEIENPQIVNGCQTVNTIYEVLKKMTDKEREDKFKNTFVMVKLLKLDKNKADNKKLYEDIVKYNNSQNAISEKDFAKNNEIFFNLQKEFKKLGFLLSIKQSDKFQLKNKEKFNDFRPKLEGFEKLFSLEFKKIDDIIIELDKFMQVILAFSKNGYEAFTKKSQLLKPDSNTLKYVIKYIKDGDLTHKDLINLYLLFLKAEKEKKQSEDKRTPIPFYVLGFLGKEINQLNGEELRRKFRYIFENKNNFETLYNFYKIVSRRYKQNMKVDYNYMIKAPINYNILQDTINNEFEMIEKDKDIIKKYFEN